MLDLILLECIYLFGQVVIFYLHLSILGISTLLNESVKPQMQELMERNVEYFQENLNGQTVQNQKGHG